MDNEPSLTRTARDGVARRGRAAHDALVLHPGNSAAESVYAVDTVGALGNYSYDVDLRSVGTNTTNGVGYTFFTTSALGVVTLGPRQVLPTYTSTGALADTQLFAAGEPFGVIIDYNGFCGGDSIALNFSASAVPEPATWGMIMLGLGKAGFGLRRRQSKVAAAFLTPEGSHPQDERKAAGSIRGDGDFLKSVRHGGECQWALHLDRR